MRGFSLLLRGGRKFILLTTGNVVFRRHVFGCRAHVIVVVGVPESIDDHAIDEFGVAHAKAIAGPWQYVRRRTHVLLTAGDDDLSIATLYGLCRKMRRLQTATTYFADRHRRYHVRYASTDQCLSGAVLADTRCEHLTHDDFRNLLRLDAATCEQCFDDLRTQIGGRDFRNGAVKFAHRRSQCGRNYHIVHKFFLRRDHPFWAAAAHTLSPCCASVL